MNLVANIFQYHLLVATNVYNAGFFMLTDIQYCRCNCVVSHSQVYVYVNNLTIYNH